MKNNNERERERQRQRQRQKEFTQENTKGLVYNTTASIIHTCTHEQYKLPTNSITEYNTQYTIPNTNTNTCGLKGTDNRPSGLCDVLQTITTTNNNSPLAAAASKDHNPSLLI